MDITTSGPVEQVTVTLSRRNLTQLLQMLDKKVGMPSLTRIANKAHVTVLAEEDAEHYKGRTPGPGFRDQKVVGVGMVPDPIKQVREVKS